MNTCIEDVRVHNEYAIRCSIVSKPVNVVEYVKAVSTKIGASHILAVFEDRDSVKIFLKDKRFVDTLVKSCLHVMGRHVKVDYVSPPGTRLVLTEVDPVISNYDVMRLLSVYGTVVSPVIRPPISDDTELCHIGHGVRYVYMNLATDIVPEKIEFKYGEHIYNFKIFVETADVMYLANIKVDTFSDTPLENENSDSSTLSQDNSSPPVLVSVQSFHSEEEGREPPKFLTSSANRDQATTVKKRRGRPPNPVKHMRIAKRLTATSKAAGKIKQTVKHTWIKRHYRKCKQAIKTVSPAKRALRKLSNVSSSSSSPFPLESVLPEVEIKEYDANDKVLNQDQLLEFLDEAKNQRAPLELVKKYVGDGSDSVNKFIEQLDAFHKQQIERTLKIRVSRLVKSLKDSLNNSNQSVSLDLID